MFQKKRGAAPCEVRQLPGLDYTEPRFEISVRAADDRCQVKLFLDIGTVPGGSDVMKEKELGGQSTIIKEVYIYNFLFPILRDFRKFKVRRKLKINTHSETANAAQIADFLVDNVPSTRFFFTYHWLYVKCETNDICTSDGTSLGTMQSHK